MSFRKKQARFSPSCSKKLLRQALSPFTKNKRITLLTLSVLATAPYASKLSAEPLKKQKSKQQVASSSKLSNQSKLRTGLGGHIFKNLPFEPLTDNRLASLKKSQEKKLPTVRKGKSWIELTVKEGDSLYQLVRRNGLSIKELYTIMHLGEEISSLKLLKPGQKLQIHASDHNILEMIHHQNNARKLHVKKENGQFSALTTVNGVAVATPPSLAKSRPSRVARSLISQEDFPSLRHQSDSDLQNKLERTLQQLDLMKQINKRKLAVALVDISDINSPKLAMLNGDEMMYAASLPKIAILLGAFVEIEQGNMDLDKNTRESLTQMIRFSSNTSATEMLGRVGNYRLQEILMSDRFKLYDPLHNGGLWVGKAYGKTPAFERDPLHNLSHGATVLQAARFYYMMETGQLVSSDLTADMKEMLSEPKINHKFVKGLAERPEAKIYRKSGSWRQWHADSALIEANGYKYIAVALAEDPKGGQWLSNMIAPLHDIIVPKTYAELSD